MKPRYLLADEAEATILSDALEGFPQHWVKGLVAVSERCSGVTRDGEGSNVNLYEIKQKSFVFFCKSFGSELNIIF